MRFLHTADWHIGNLFHEYDRGYEHQQFLHWLQQTIVREEIDVLLVCGDVFDISNPSAASIKMFYSFLNKVTSSSPHLQIIITAGNHDSASRLEAPKPLLDHSHIQIIGVIERNEHGEIDYEKLIIPVRERNGSIKGYCLAVPFLRLGDYPNVEDCSNPYADGVNEFYRTIHECASQKIKEGEFIIALGHLHAQSAEISEQDKTERLIMGGIESVSAQSFHPGISYVALGHIHKAQRIGGMEHIRYCGSPLPMSFSEINYKHQVVVFDINEKIAVNIRVIEVPLAIPLLQIPIQHKPVEEVLKELDLLEPTEAPQDQFPYLQVRVLLKGPEPSLRHKIEAALKDKKVRLAKIDVKYPGQNKEEGKFIAQDQLHELKPFDIFSTLYKTKYQTAVPEEMAKMFNQVAGEINQKED